MADWIFQANPRLYDVHGAVAKSRRDWWSTPRFRDRVVFLLGQATAKTSSAWLPWPADSGR